MAGGLTKSQVKRLIQAKFFSVSRFCRLTEQRTSYGSIRVFLNRKPDEPATGQQRSRLHELYTLAKRTPQRSDEGEITASNRSWLNELMREVYGGNLSAFCRANPSFARMTVHDILTGSTRHKTDAYDQLVDVLNRKAEARRRLTEAIDARDNGK